MFPNVGRRRPLINPKRTDLPAPLGPTMARISPFFTSRETLFNAASPAKCLERFLISSNTLDLPFPMGIGPGPVPHGGDAAHQPAGKVDDNNDQQDPED